MPEVVILSIRPVHLISQKPCWQQRGHPAQQSPHHLVFKPVIPFAGHHHTISPPLPLVTFFRFKNTCYEYSCTMYAVHFKTVLLNHARSNSTPENLWPATTIKNLWLFSDEKLVLTPLHEPLPNPFLTINYLKRHINKSLSSCASSSIHHRK